MTHLRAKAFGDDGGEVEAFKVVRGAETVLPLWILGVIETEDRVTVNTASGSFTIPYDTYMVNYRHGIEVLDERALKNRFKSVSEAKVNEDELREQRGSTASLTYFDQVNPPQPQAVHGTRTAGDTMRTGHERAIQEEAAQARRDMSEANAKEEDAGSVAQARARTGDREAQRSGAFAQPATAVDTTKSGAGDEKNVDNPADTAAKQTDAARREGSSDRKPLGKPSQAGA